MSTSPDNRLKRLIREIHRRSLWQVLGIYLVGGWVAFEVVHTLTEGLGLPEWFPALAVVLLIIGLPVVMATAFVQEGPGEPSSDAASQAGIVARDREIEAGGALRHLTWRNALLGGLGAFGLWGIAATMWLLAGDGAPFTGDATSSPSGDGVQMAGETASDDRPAVAVLPFENMSGEADDEYFTDGMHEEILSRLSKVGGLRLISRTSVLQYEDSPQNVRQIAEELGVGYVGEGSVRRAEDVVRITVQLIDASSDEHVWSETYDRELSPSAIFDIQSDVAQRIAEALHTKLSPEEAARVAERPTESVEAYDYYLHYRSHAKAGNWAEATRMLRRATEVDPTYTEAWASLAGRHIGSWWTRADFSDERLELARAAIDRARRLDPEHPATLRAQGEYHYYVEEDWERAAHYLERAVRADPNRSPTWESLAYLRRRMGEFEGAIDAFARAEVLDPADAPRGNLADTYAFLRRWEETHAVEARARLWDPTYAGRWMQLGTPSYREGDVERARSELRQAIDAGLSSRIFLPLAQNALARTYLAERRYDESLSLAEGFEYDFVGGDIWEPRSFLIAQIHDFAGREEEARRWYDSARVALEPRAENDPKYGLSSYGVVLAALGRAEEAVEAGRRAVELTPIEHDAFLGTMRLEYLARIYARVGELDAAMDLVEELLDRPSFLTVPRLRIEPYWDPLREHPRFRELLGS